MTREQAIQAAVGRFEKRVKAVNQSLKKGKAYGIPMGRAETEFHKDMKLALTALREALERGQGCEYCEKGKRIKNACYTNAFAEVCKHSKSFAVHMPLNFGSADCDFFINYCPMCGRKLEDEK